MTNIHDPIACSLTTKDAAEQRLAWLDLQRHARAAKRIEGGVALTFDPELARGIEDLAARERSCCGFLSIATVRSHDELRLEITSDNPAARPMIEAMAGLDDR
ncbi:MAG: hypothetical protein BMS9Abin12_1660 [Acidimicrobiia bacterium]|nr:MAG: hypothetical protein BMS9Abin12_1660 [Acidimicrobiia bacterium]